MESDKGGQAPDLGLVEGLAELAARHGLSELTLELDDEGGGPAWSLTIRRPAEALALASATPAAPGALPPPAAPEPLPAGTEVCAPMTGVFYRTPGPDLPPFVEVGDVVAVGQAIGLIEAMKVFSEIPCEAAGRVTAIVAENGRLVTQGQPLLLVAPL